jgi:hypothetical protein
MQNKYQEQFGYPIPRTARKVRPRMALTEPLPKFWVFVHPGTFAKPKKSA